MSVRPLPRRVRHKEQETALSLALRLCRREGVPWSKFARATGLERSGLRTSLSLDRLSALSTVPTERLARWTPMWLGDEMDVLGHRLDRSQSLRLNLRVCPLCMDEDVRGRADGERAEDAAYLRLEWCMAFVFGCGRHGTRLVTRCPACDARPRWGVGRIDACHCGSSLTARPPAALSATETRVLGFLLDRLHRRAHASPTLARLEHVPLRDLVDLLRSLGRVGVERARGRTSRHGEGNDQRDLLVAGAEALDGFPRSFERFLDEVCEAPASPGPGWRGLYGVGMVRWMLRDRPFMEELRPVFLRHGAGRAALPERRTGPDPASRHQRDEERRTRLLAAGEMERLRSEVGWGSPSPARRHEVLAAELGRGVLTAEASAARLAVPEECFRRLTAAGAFSEIWPATKSLFFYRSELDRFVSGLIGDAPTHASPPPGCMDLRSLSYGRREPWWSLLMEVASGRIGVVGVAADRRGLSALLFADDRAPLRSVASSKTRVSSQRTFAVLHLRWQGLDAVRRAGLLPVGNGAAAASSTFEEIERFDGRYVSLARAAVCTGIGARRLRSELAAAGVDSCLEYDKGAVYERRALEGFLGSGIVPFLRLEDL